MGFRYVPPRTLSFHTIHRRHLTAARFLVVCFCCAVCSSLVSLDVPSLCFVRVQQRKTRRGGKRPQSSYGTAFLSLQHQTVDVLFPHSRLPKQFSRQRFIGPTRLSWWSPSKTPRLERTAKLVGLEMPLPIFFTVS